jgi:hypothetical protein
MYENRSSIKVTDDHFRRAVAMRSSALQNPLRQPAGIASQPVAGVTVSA